MDCVNPTNFMWGPRHAEYWAEAIKMDLLRTSTKDREGYVLLKDRVL